MCFCQVYFSISNHVMPGIFFSSCSISLPDHLYYSTYMKEGGDTLDAGQNGHDIKHDRG